MNHSDAGPNRSTTAAPRIPNAIPNRKSTSRNRIKTSPYARNDNPKIVVARTSITTSPTELVAMLDRTSPLTYSEIESGEAKIFRKLRDQTSSMNAIVTPCMTRVKKSQSRTAPRKTGTKSNAAELTAFRYFVMNAQRTITYHSKPNNGNTRAGLPLTR